MIPKCVDDYERLGVSFDDGLRKPPLGVSLEGGLRNPPPDPLDLDFWKGACSKSGIEVQKTIPPNQRTQMNVF